MAIAEVVIMAKQSGSHGPNIPTLWLYGGRRVLIHDLLSILVVTFLAESFLAESRVFGRFLSAIADLSGALLN
jgi:hypothetical protein